MQQSLVTWNCPLGHPPCRRQVDFVNCETTENSWERNSQAQEFLRADNTVSHEAKVLLPIRRKAHFRLPLTIVTGKPGTTDTKARHANYYAITVAHNV